MPAQFPRTPFPGYDALGGSEILTQIFSGTPGSGAPGAPVVTGWLARTRRLTNAEILALSVTPILLVPPPGVSLILNPLFMIVQEHTAAAYGLGAAPDLRFVGTTTSLITAGQTVWNTVIRDRLWVFGVPTGSVSFLQYSAQDPRNKGLEIRTGTAMGGGGAANFCDVSVIYQIMPSTI